MTVQTLKKTRPTVQSMLPTKWSIADVRQITGCEILDVIVRKKWIICVLDSSIYFHIKRW